jgi:hypothetical protein
LIIGGEWVTPMSWQATTLPPPDVGPQPYHADHHIVVFAPERGTPDRIYVATDGGVFRADDWTRPETFSSIHNRGLRNLQFYDFCLATLETPRGIVAGGLQDNGNVWKINDTGGTWRPTFGAGGTGSKAAMAVATQWLLLRATSVAPTGKMPFPRNGHSKDGR